MLKDDPDLVISGNRYPFDNYQNNWLHVTRSTIQARFFRRFLRTNAPAALRQVWGDVRIWCRLQAVGSFTVQHAEKPPRQGRLAENSWFDFDPNMPDVTASVLNRFADDFVTTYFRFDGGCQNPDCDIDIRSGVAFKASRNDPAGTHCACVDRLFSDDSLGVVGEALVIPRLVPGASATLQALVFLSGPPIKAKDVRFLRSAAGLHFAQQAIWDSGRRQEPAVALRPREIECVRWAVAGKTLAEIAEITGLSYRTVRFHLDAARSRYGFSTNQQLFVQAAKDYGLDPDADAIPVSEEDRLVKPLGAGRLQPQWTERRSPRDRRAVTDRRQVVLANLPFPDRRQNERRHGDERRTIADETGTTANELLTPDEIRALLN